MNIRHFLCAACLLSAQSDSVYAQEESHKTFGAGESALIWGGWLAGGITGNPASPDNHSNRPVGFNDQSNVPQLNQINLYLEKAVNHESDEWSIGGRVDFMGGTDTRFTQAKGYWDANLINANDSRYYNIAIPQAYVEIAAPGTIGTDLTVKLGHFYTIIGHESVMAPGNFFYSHSYAMLYGEPFVHTGALFSLQANDQLSVSMGGVTGPDNGKDNNVSDIGNWNFLGGSTWVSPSGDTALAFAVTTGNTASTTTANRTMGSLVLTHNLSEKLHYTIQHDRGYQGNSQALGENQVWYGINQYLVYDIDELWSGGIRAEWFRDQNGGRVSTGPNIADYLGPGSYYEITGGLNWRAKDWLIVRPEVRYDWSDAAIKPFDDQTRNQQWLLSISSIISF